MSLLRLLCATLYSQSDLPCFWSHETISQAKKCLRFRDCLVHTRDGDEG